MAMETESPVVFDETTEQEFMRDMNDYLQTRELAKSSSLAASIAALVGPVVAEAVSSALGAMKAVSLSAEADAAIVAQKAASRALRENDARTLSLLRGFVSAQDTRGVEVQLTSIFSNEMLTTIYMQIGKTSYYFSREDMTTAQLFDEIMKHVETERKKQADVTADVGTAADKTDDCLF